jgi:hypothetical protein
MADALPPKVRDFVAQRVSVGRWPKFGDINYPVHEAVEAMADYIDMIAAKVVGERLAPDD